METIQKYLSIVYEWLLTFSNKPSFFSSKRIERFVIFSTMLACTIIFLWKNTISCEKMISSTDFMIVVGGWLGYAGFGIVQGRKDNKPEEVKNEPVE